MNPIVLALAVLIQTPVASHEVEACATQLRNAKGHLVFTLWRATDPGFPEGDRGRPFRRLSVPAAMGKALFRDIPAGSYALSVFHDEKGTGAIDRNLIGLPRSGVGVSGEFSRPPSFARSQFIVTGPLSIPVSIRYLM